ncbi:MAG: hypothetical protein WA691_00345 [Thermoplasmata archaeon]
MESRRRRFTESTRAIYDCSAGVRVPLPKGREPSGYGPQLQTEIVLGNIEERWPYRECSERLAPEGIPNYPAGDRPESRRAMEGRRGWDPRETPVRTAGLVPESFDAFFSEVSSPTTKGALEDPAGIGGANPSLQVLPNDL